MGVGVAINDETYKVGGVLDEAELGLAAYTHFCCCTHEIHEILVSNILLEHWD